MAGPCVPGPVAESGIADAGKPKAFPFPAGRQAASTPTAELIGQRNLLPVAVAKDDGTEFAGITLVRAKDLLPIRHRLGEQAIGRAGCRSTRCSGHSINSKRMELSSPAGAVAGSSRR